MNNLYELQCRLAILRDDFTRLETDDKDIQKIIEYLEKAQSIMMVIKK